MNPAKSKYDPLPAPKKSTTPIESDGTKYKVDGHTVNADGTETNIFFDAKTDGNDYPLSGTPNADKVSSTPPKPVHPYIDVRPVGVLAFSN